MLMDYDFTLEELLETSKNEKNNSISDFANKNETYKLRMMIDGWEHTDTYGENIDFLSSLQSYDVYFKKESDYIKIISLIGTFIDGIVMTLSNNTVYYNSNEIGLEERIEVRNI